MRIRFLSISFLTGTAALLAVGCTRVPEVEERVSDDLRSASYPELIPLHTALEELPAPQTAGAKVEETLKARRDRLQARANRLRNSTE